jgi:hypothetical protein
MKPTRRAAYDGSRVETPPQQGTVHSNARWKEARNHRAVFGLYRQRRSNLCGFALFMRPGTLVMARYAARDTMPPSPPDLETSSAASPTVARLSPTHLRSLWAAVSAVLHALYRISHWWRLPPAQMGRPTVAMDAPCDRDKTTNRGETESQAAPQVGLGPSRAFIMARHQGRYLDALLELSEDFRCGP